MKGIGINNLLSKTTLVYLVFTLIAFYVTAKLLETEFTKNIDQELEGRFRREEGKTRWSIENGHDRSKRNPNTAVIALDAKPDTVLYPVYLDTMMLHRNSEELMLHRIKRTVVNVGGNNYMVTMISDMEDLITMREEIVEVMVPSFIILAAVLLFFSLVLSGYYFRPFNKILENMKTYKVGYPDFLSPTKTSTTEFRKMQNLFQGMVEKIEDDYNNIREYTENMAHEIQTPLAIIRNKAENLMSNDSVMKAHTMEVKAIYDESNRISTLGVALNLLTKIENEEFSSEEQIKTKPIIENHLEAIKELADLKSIVIETILSDDHELHIDPRLFDILITNMTRNALHYGTADGPIRVSSSHESLTFSNYGEPLEVSSEKIFERFYKSNSSKVSLGLGLALVKKICDMNSLKITYGYSNGQHEFTIS
ncbi:sensor histidine kinase [Bacteroidota bacterium]